MDGGPIQLEAAKDILENELGLNVPVAAMVKNDKHRTADLLSEVGDTPLHLDPKSQGFYLLQRIQDEVHRFAITFHRKVHAKNSLSSRLDDIAGVGPKTRNKLLREFGSMKKIAAASTEELQKLGISKPVADTIHLTLAKMPETN